MQNQKESNQIQELTLLLLSLTSWTEEIAGVELRRAWKGYDFDVLDQLYEEGLISGSRKAKSVCLTEAGIENLLPGRIAGHDAAGGVSRIELEGGIPLTVPLAATRPVGAQVMAAIRAEDVLVSSAPVKGLSARNVYEARLEGLERTGVDVTLRCALAATPSGYFVHAMASSNVTTWSPIAWRVSRMPTVTAVS